LNVSEAGFNPARRFVEAVAFPRRQTEHFCCSNLLWMPGLGEVGCARILVEYLRIGWLLGEVDWLRPSDFQFGDLRIGFGLKGVLNLFHPSVTECAHPRIDL